MNRVTRAARRFDQTPCTDAYTGALAFHAQIGLFDDTKRDSESGERRILSVGPGVAIPARRVVAAAGLRFIVGHGNPDTYRGDVVRIGYVAHEATHLAQVQTLGQICRGEPGFQAWAGMAWIKNLADDGHSSDVTQEHHIHLAQGEPVTTAKVLTLGSSRYLARTVRQGPAGTLIALSDLMAEPSVEIVSVTTGPWDPRTELPGAKISVRVLRARWQSLYEYQNSDAPKFGPADLQLVMAKSAHTPAAGHIVEALDGHWTLAAVADEGDVWICRAVRRGKA